MNRTPVIITIDTEFSSHRDDMGIIGDIEGVQYSVPLLYRFLEEYKFKATWFVDVYNTKEDYLETFKEWMLKLKSSHHDLQLHTHPHGLFDPKREMMCEYTLDEQVEIISKGIKLFKEWFGIQPFAHRAGDWAANYDTLEALKRNGITYDSSMFHGWHDCHLNSNPFTKNRIKKFNGIVQVPATSFKCLDLGLFAPYRLLSTDGNSFSETWYLMKSLHRHQAGVINLVYHSFSFLKWNDSRTEYSVNHNRIRKFKKLLRALDQSNQFTVMSLKELKDVIDECKGEALICPDHLPSSGMISTALRLVDRVMP